jgi:hypothetical protein
VITREHLLGTAMSPLGYDLSLPWRVSRDLVPLRLIGFEGRLMDLDWIKLGLLVSLGLCEVAHLWGNAQRDP